MSAASRPVSTGKTRTCPHCKATILESLSICPGCMHHLRFDSEAAKRQVAAAPALRVEGIIRHPPLEQPLEYFVIIAIRNDRGEEVTRQVVNVGALQAAEKRTFTLSVEVLPPQAPVATKTGSTTGTYKSPTQPASATTTSTPAAGTSAPSAGTPASTGVKQPVPSTAAAPASTGAKSPLAAQPKPPGAYSSGSMSPKAPGVSSGAADSNPAAETPGASPPTPGAVSPPPSSHSPNPATPAKPTSGYVLKPPSPGGPKRH